MLILLGQRSLLMGTSHFRQTNQIKPARFGSLPGLIEEIVDPNDLLGFVVGIELVYPDSAPSLPNLQITTAIIGIVF